MGVGDRPYPPYPYRTPTPAPARNRNPNLTMCGEGLEVVEIAFGEALEHRERRPVAGALLDYKESSRPLSRPMEHQRLAHRLEL